MTEQIEVDDFLAHYGVPGMKWGRRNSRSESPKSSKDNSDAASPDKPKMSRNKKIAIGIGIGAVVAIGAAVALSSMNKNMDVPITSLINSPSAKKGAKAHAAHEARMTEVINRMRLEKESPLKTRSDLDAYRNKAVKDSGLTLGPRSAPSSSGGTNTKLAPSRSTNTPSYPRSMGGMNGSPSMSTMASLINAPAVTFNPKTGRYETK